MGTKLRKNERKGKFICTFPSASNFSERKVTVLKRNRLTKLVLSVEIQVSNILFLLQFLFYLDLHEGLDDVALEDVIEVDK